jgi:hypothetical protein
MTPMMIAPERIEIPNPEKTAFPKTFSPKRLAIDAFTMLFDITAMRIVEEARSIGIAFSALLDAISCVIASTSARPESAPST